MEERKSVLETVRPTDALGRLSARTQKSKVMMTILAVGVLLGAAFILGSIFFEVSKGPDYQAVPSVPR